MLGFDQSWGRGYSEMQLRKLYMLCHVVPNTTKATSRYRPQKMSGGQHAERSVVLIGLEHFLACLYTPDAIRYDSKFAFAGGGVQFGEECGS